MSFEISLHPITSHKFFVFDFSIFSKKVNPESFSNFSNGTWKFFSLCSYVIGSLGTSKAAIHVVFEAELPAKITLNKCVGTATLFSPIT